MAFLATSRQEVPAAQPLATGFWPRALKPITEVHNDEVVTAAVLTLNAFLLLGAYYLIKPVREALILVLASGAEYKAYLGGVIALTLLVAVPLYARAVDRLPRAKLVSGVSVFFALQLGAFFLAGLSENLRSRLGLVFFVWVGVFNMMVVAQFWAFASDVYSEEQGKRLFPLIALGASLGAVAGSRSAAFAIPRIGVFPLLLIAALLLSACAALYRAVDARERSRSRASGAQGTGERAAHKGAFRTVLTHRYLLLVALFSLVYTCVNSNGEFMLAKLVKGAAAEAVRRHEIGADGVGTFVGATYGEYFFWVNAVGLLLQTFAVSRLVRWFDFGPCFFLFPLIALADASLIAFLPLLTVVRIGKIAENAVDYSLNNTLRQLIWLPTTRDMKYKAKQAVDTFFVRMGDVGSAVLVWSATSLLSWGVAQIAVVSVVLALIWLALAAAILVEGRRLKARSPANASGSHALGAG